MTKPYDSTKSRRPRPRARPASELTGPMRKVVYIFEREGARGGGFWWLVLDCGHSVARKRVVGNHWSTMVHLLMHPIESKLAPKRVQCHYCGSGAEKQDPWIMIKAFGGGGIP
jgi:hypothetical protein